MAQGAAEQQDVRPLAEATRVRRWRLQQFYRLGFDSMQARRLADSDADLALTRRLVQSGCELQTALAIVL